MDSGETGMTSVAMTIINLRKENWPSPGSNQRPAVLKSYSLPTELWCSALQRQILDSSKLKEFADDIFKFENGGKKTLWEKEKMLVTSNFSFSRNVFKKLVLQSRKKRFVVCLRVNSFPRDKF